MKKSENKNLRRSFIKKGIALTTGISGLATLSSSALVNPKRASEDLLVIGPRNGYSPQIGALVSMLNYMRHTIINTVKDLDQEDLDFLLDENSNSIGALLMHLGATEKFYQINSFEGRQELNEKEDKIWGAAMRLGDEGREMIKGHDSKYYLDLITEVRAETLDILKTKDDEWLLEIDPIWSQPGEEVNTYWKWFHVMEHESNHGGQMRIIRDRAPSKSK